MCVDTGELVLTNAHRLREIFGPILPVIPVKDVDEAIAFINEGCVYSSRCLSLSR